MRLRVLLLAVCVNGFFGTVFGGAVVRARLLAWGETIPVEQSESVFDSDLLLGYAVDSGFVQHLSRVPMVPEHFAGRVWVDAWHPQLYLAPEHLFTGSPLEQRALSLFFVGAVFCACWSAVRRPRWNLLTQLAGLGLLAAWVHTLPSRWAGDTPFGNLTHDPDGVLRLFPLAAATLGFQHLLCLRRGTGLPRWYFLVVVVAVGVESYDAFYGSNYWFMLTLGGAVILAASTLTLGATVVQFALWGCWRMRPRRSQRTRRWSSLKRALRRYASSSRVSG